MSAKPILYVVLWLTGVPAFCQSYGGPSVLSRSNLPSIGQEAATDTIKPFVVVNQIYDTGLPSFSSGAITNNYQPVVGTEIGFGATGVHRWRRMQVSIDYNGDFRQYSHRTLYDGTNQFVGISFSRALKRHVTFTARETAGSVSAGFSSLLLRPSYLDTSTTLPTNEPFDLRVRFLDSQVMIGYQRSARLSFTASVDHFLVRQQSSSLYNLNGNVFTGDMSYRWTRRTSVGLDYKFLQYGYDKLFGGADFHNINVDYAWRLSKTVDVAAQLGVMRGSILGIGIVSLDPEVASILGTTSGIRVSYQLHTAPNVSAQITKRFQHASTTLRYQRGVSPGNALMLTSSSETIMGSFHYSGSPHWNFSVQGGRNAMNAISTSSTYTGFMAGAAFTRKIRPTLQAVTRFDVRQYNAVGLLSLNRTFYRASVGLMFTPNERPISIR